MVPMRERNGEVVGAVPPSHYHQDSLDTRQQAGKPSSGTNYQQVVFVLINIVHLFAIVSLNPYVHGGEFNDVSRVLLVDVSALLHSIEYKEGLVWFLLCVAWAYFTWRSCWARCGDSDEGVHDIWSILYASASTGGSIFIFWFISSPELSSKNPDQFTLMLLLGLLLLAYPAYFLLGCWHSTRNHRIKFHCIPCKWKYIGNHERRYSPTSDPMQNDRAKTPTERRQESKVAFRRYADAAFEVTTYLLYPGMVLTFGQLFKTGLVDKQVMAVIGILFATLLILALCSSTLEELKETLEDSKSFYSNIFTEIKCCALSKPRCTTLFVLGFLLEKVILIFMVIHTLPDLNVRDNSILPTDLGNGTNTSVTTPLVNSSETDVGMNYEYVGVRIGSFSTIVMAAGLILTVIAPYKYSTSKSAGANGAREMTGLADKRKPACCSGSTFPWYSFLDATSRFALGIYLIRSVKSGSNDEDIEVLITILCIIVIAFALLLPWAVFCKCILQPCAPPQEPGPEERQSFSSV